MPSKQQTKVPEVVSADVSMNSEEIEAEIYAHIGTSALGGMGGDLN